MARLGRKRVGNSSRILKALYTRNICALTTAKPLQDARLWGGDSRAVHGLGVVELGGSGFRYHEQRKVVHASDLEVGKEVGSCSQTQGWAVEVADKPPQTRVMSLQSRSPGRSFKPRVSLEGSSSLQAALSGKKV